MKADWFAFFHYIGNELIQNGWRCPSRPDNGYPHAPYQGQILSCARKNYFLY